MEGGAGWDAEEEQDGGRSKRRMGPRLLAGVAKCGYKPTTSGVPVVEHRQTRWPRLAAQAKQRNGTAMKRGAGGSATNDLWLRRRIHPNRATTGRRDPEVGVEMGRFGDVASQKGGGGFPC